VKQIKRIRNVKREERRKKVGRVRRNEQERRKRRQYTKIKFVSIKGNEDEQTLNGGRLARIARYASDHHSSPTL
jgi:hypothetical protein